MHTGARLEAARALYQPPDFARLLGIGTDAHLTRNLTDKEWQQYASGESYRLARPNLPGLEESEQLMWSGGCQKVYPAGQASRGAP
ncbi:MAG: hypothetical protein AB7P69_03040 [Candidatus Binatia bacterium]